MNTNKHRQGFLKAIIEGMASVMVIYPENAYQQPDKTGFIKDREALNGDARKVAANLNKTLSAYGQIDYR